MLGNCCTLQPIPVTEKLVRIPRSVRDEIQALPQENKSAALAALETVTNEAYLPQWRALKLDVTQFPEERGGNMKAGYNPKASIFWTGNTRVDSRPNRPR